jgi:hypothetical protein
MAFSRTMPPFSHVASHQNANTNEWVKLRSSVRSTTHKKWVVERIDNDYVNGYI